MREALYFGAALALLPLVSADWNGGLAAIWSSFSQHGAALLGGECHGSILRLPTLPGLNAASFSAMPDKRATRRTHCEVFPLELSVRAGRGGSRCRRAFRLEDAVCDGPGEFGGSKLSTFLDCRRERRYGGAVALCRAADAHSTFSDEFRSLLHSALVPAVVRDRVRPGVGFVYIRYGLSSRLAAGSPDPMGQGRRPLGHRGRRRGAPAAQQSVRGCSSVAVAAAAARGACAPLDAAAQGGRVPRSLRWPRRRGHIWRRRSARSDDPVCGGLPGARACPDAWPSCRPPASQLSCSASTAASCCRSGAPALSSRCTYRSHRCDPPQPSRCHPVAWAHSLAPDRARPRRRTG